MIEHPQKFTLTIEEENNVYSHSFVVEDSSDWQYVTLKLLDLVSACWGYDVKESIVFVSHTGVWDWWGFVGEKTISREGLAKAQEFDRLNSGEFDEEEE